MSELHLVLILDNSSYQQNIREDEVNSLTESKTYAQKCVHVDTLSSSITNTLADIINTSKTI